MTKKPSQKQLTPEREPEKNPVKFKLGPLEIEGRLGIVFSLLVGLVAGIGLAWFVIVQYQQPAVLIDPVISQALAATLTARPPTTPTSTPTPANTPESPPSVALVSLRYIVDNYDPRMVDLRTASSSGIPGTAGRALRLFDLFVSVPADAPEYVIQAEIYVNSQIVGATSSTPLQAGTTNLGDVNILSYNDGTVPNAWRIQPDWKDLLVFLVTYREGRVVDRYLTTIRLSADGDAWLIDPPNMNFASIVYAVNDGPELALDLRNAERVGLGVRPHDKLTLREIWYHSNASSDRTFIYAEASLLAEGKIFDRDSYQATPQNVIRRGINKFDFSPLSWTIPDDRRFLDLTLYRSDGAVMDMLILPLMSEN
jgi:hypothetical protein